jgi:flagellar FliL protein
MTDKADPAAEDVADAAAGEDGEGEGGGQGPGKKFGKKKLILFAAIGLVVVLIGAGAGIYFSGLLGGETDEEHAGEPAKPAKPAKPVVAHYLDLDEMVITLGGVGRKSSFLKMRLSLELGSPDDEARVKAIMPRIVDNFQVFLRELRIEELQGSQGLYRVKEELLARVNSAAHPTKVRDVLFREMLVQ